MSGVVEMLRFRVELGAWGKDEVEMAERMEIGKVPWETGREVHQLLFEQHHIILSEFVA